MKSKYNYLMLASLIITITVLISVNNDSSISDELRLEKIKVTSLEKNITLIENENTTLKTQLNKKNIQVIAESNIDTTTDENTQDHNNNKTTESAVANKLRVEDQTIISERHNPETDSAEITDNIDDFVDINKPFNGVNPTSPEQQEIYTSFKYEIDTYSFDERFDMDNFLSDSRFSELHASLGVKLMDYVDTKLLGIKLNQYSDSEELPVVSQIE